MLAWTFGRDVKKSTLAKTSVDNLILSRCQDYLTNPVSNSSARSEMAQIFWLVERIPSTLVTALLVALRRRPCSLVAVNRSPPRIAFSWTRLASVNKFVSPFEFGMSSTRRGCIRMWAGGSVDCPSESVLIVRYASTRVVCCVRSSVMPFQRSACSRASWPPWIDALVACQASCKIVSGPLCRSLIESIVCVLTISPLAHATRKRPMMNSKHDVPSCEFVR